MALLKLQIIINNHTLMWMWGMLQNLICLYVCVYIHTCLTSHSSHFFPSCLQFLPSIHFFNCIWYLWLPFFSCWPSCAYFKLKKIFYILHLYELCKFVLWNLICLIHFSLCPNVRISFSTLQVSITISNIPFFRATQLVTQYNCMYTILCWV